MHTEVIATKLNKKAIIVTLIITLLISLYFVVYFCFLLSLVDGLLKYALGILPLVFLAAMWIVCIERIKEIKKGENNDLSQY